MPDAFFVQMGAPFGMLILLLLAQPIKWLFILVFPDCGLKRRLLRKINRRVIWMERCDAYIEGKVISVFRFLFCR